MNYVKAMDPRLRGDDGDFVAVFGYLVLAPLAGIYLGPAVGVCDPAAG